MVINHLEKLFVTNDAATVIKELEVREGEREVHLCVCVCVCSCPPQVEHPAAKMLVMAMERQEQEVLASQLSLPLH